jgi:hypothetical protein
VVNQLVEGPHGFVQTVLLVDDQALADADAGDGSDPHPVDTKKITEELADQGLSCTLLAPGSVHDPDRARVTTLARNADVVILDWVIAPGARGEDRYSLPILKSIVAADLQEGGRLRLVIIYTGYERPGEIVDDVVSVFEEDLKLTASRGLMRVTASNVQVVVVGKPDSRAEIEKMDGTELARRLVSMFTDAFADGLLRRVALAGVSAVRRQAHHLLTKFPAELDEAYLSHRGMTSPVAAEQFARQLISDEITTLLTDAGIDKWVCQAEVDAVLKESFQGDGSRYFSIRKGKIKAVSSDDAQRLLSETRAVQDKACDVDWNDVATLTGLFEGDNDKAKAAERAQEADELFAILSVYSRHCAEPPRTGPSPRLGLGTVLLRGSSYWLCMQPLCDGARLSDVEPTPFPLLPLKLATDGSPFDLVLPNNRPRLRVRLDVKLNRLLLPTFLPTERGAVAAFREDRDWFFAPADGGSSFQWIAQLRMDQAHRFAAFLGNSAGRIGLDEPEWSRLRAGRS